MVGGAAGEITCSPSSYRHRLVGMIAILVTLTSLGTFVLDGEPNPREVQAADASSSVTASSATIANSANLMSTGTAENNPAPVTSTPVRLVEIASPSLVPVKQGDVAAAGRTETSVSGSSYVLQLAALHDARSAEKICRALHEIKNRCHVQQSSAGSNQVFRVRFGPLRTKERAQELKARIALEGFTSTIVRAESSDGSDHGA
jgi:cell division septation protein DedD